MAFPSTHTALRLAACTLLAAALAGCGRNSGPRVYTAPKDPEELPKPADPATEERPARTEQLVPVTWVLPEGWLEVPPDRMSRAAFHAKLPQGDAMITLAPMGDFSEPDKELMVVNMLRGAASQDELSAAGLKELPELPVGDSTGRILDLTRIPGEGGAEHRAFTVMHHRRGTTWLIKLSGADAAVEAARPAFETFLKSLQFTADSSDTPDTGPAPAPAAAEKNDTQPAAEADPDPNAGPRRRVVIPAGQVGEPGAGKKRVVLPENSPPIPGTPPADWKALTPGQMQAAKFSVGTAEVSVAIFPSDVGGLAANVNRWRGQLGLPQLSTEEAAAAAKPLASGPEGSVSVDMENAGKSMTAAIVTRGGQWFFYKLTGETAAVQAARESFLAFAAAK